MTYPSLVTDALAASNAAHAAINSMIAEAGGTYDCSNHAAVFAIEKAATDAANKALALARAPFRLQMTVELRGNQTLGLTPEIDGTAQGRVSRGEP